MEGNNAVLIDGGTEDRLRNITKWFNELEMTGASIETLDRSQVDEYHQFAVNALLRYVWEKNPFYNEILRNAGYDGVSELNLQEIQNIPFLQKEDLNEHYKDILTKTPLAQISKSTGTTGGKPSYIGHTLDELYNYYFAPKYPSLMQKAKNTVVANALPYEMSSSALTFHHEFSHLLGCTILPIGKGGAYSDPGNALQFMMDWNAEVLVTTPSYAIDLYEAAVAAGLNTHTDLSVKHIFLTGEGTSHHFRQRIEECWNCTSTILYGSLEAMLIGIECGEQDGFHVADGHLYLEIVDPISGERQENGQQGEIVVTTLLREGMPLIRYKTGDMGYIDESECACGISLPRLYLRGRIGDQLKLAGESFSPFYLEDIIMREPEMGNSYRFIIKDEILRLEVEPRNEHTDRQLLIENLQSLLEFHTNEMIDVSVVDRVQRNKGKIKRIWNES
jgi:phenylacetate-CoA ligase